jgi:uncharacterized membrane protein
MAKKDKHVVIAYYPGADKADDASDQLKSWDKANDDIKLGGIGILFWEDGKIKTRKVGGHETSEGAGWGLALGAALGILSGGVTLIGGALAGVAGGAVLGSFFHKGLGLSDADKQRLDEKLQAGGAALVAMCDADEIDATKAELASLGGEVEDYKVPDETVEKVEEATEVQPADDASSDDNGS